MLGKTKYTDEGVVNTFKNWARAIDAGCFMDDHQNYSWQEAQAPLINGEACLLYTSPSPRDGLLSRMPSSA